MIDSAIALVFRQSFENRSVNSSAAKFSCFTSHSTTQFLDTTPLISFMTSQRHADGRLITLSDWIKISLQILSKSLAKVRLVTIGSHSFSGALRQAQGFSLGYDWFVSLFLFWTKRKNKQKKKN